MRRPRVAYVLDEVESCLAAARRAPVELLDVNGDRLAPEQACQLVLVGEKASRISSASSITVGSWSSSWRITIASCFSASVGSFDGSPAYRRRSLAYTGCGRRSASTTTPPSG
jgi:hypothetical protein